MAVQAVTNPTLVDVAKRLDPDGKIDSIVELLKQTNEIIEDATWVEGNLPTGHRTTVRTGLPAPTWRKLYGGVQPTKSTTAQVTDNTGMLEAYAEVDKALADLNGNTAAFRLSEDQAFIQGMNDEFSQTLFYGNEGTEPEAFTGLAPRYNTLGGNTADNVITGAGTGADNTSIWLVVWGPNTAHCIYPKGSTAGLSVVDKGQVTVEDASAGSNTGRMEAYRTHYKWDCGFVVRDWRYVVRIPNIDKSELTIGATGSSANLTDLMVQALEVVPSLTMGRPVFYVNRSIRSWLRRQIGNKGAHLPLTLDTAGGKHVVNFDGIPVRRCDQILNTEAAIA